MKNLARTLGLTISLAVLFSLATSALAYGPVLSVSNNGSNTNITVSGANPYSSIQLSYTSPGSSLPTTISNFGTTDGSGYFTTSVSQSSYGISNGASMYATVGGQQSNIVIMGNVGGGCAYNCGSPYGLSLSQTSLNLNVGQSASVTAYNYSGGNLYVSSNSNPAAVSANASGSRIDFYGLTPGSSTVSICSNYSGYSSGNCANVYVTVGGGSGSALTLSQTNLNLNVGQSATVTASYPYILIYPSVNNLYISSNSNSSVASASVSNPSAIIVQGLSSGSSTIIVCANGISQCANLYVTVGWGGSGGNVWFSPSNPSLYVGQSLAVSVNSSAGTAYTPYYSNAYYISSNSNSAAVSANLSGTVLNLQALQAGSANINVCHSSLNFCAVLYVTVTGGIGAGNLSLSQTSLNLNVGQSASVTAYNYSGGNLYVSSNSNPAAVSANASGSRIDFYGLTPGSSTVSICSNYSGYSSGNCANVYVTVAGLTANNLTFSQNNINLNLNQNLGVTVYGGVGLGSYYISSNSNSAAVSAGIAGNLVSLVGQNNGNSQITVCQNNSASCGVLYVTVSGYGTGSLSFSTLALPQPVVNQYYSSQLLVTGGNPPYTYYLNSGALPSGLSLSSSGQIFGTPQSNFASAFSVRVSDNFGRSATANFTLTPSGTVLGANIYNNGQLINDGGTVYIVYKNSKTGFVSAAVFRALGFKFISVISGPTSGLNNSGYVIRTASAAHPWGSWIKSGGTVYFVHESGLIPVGDYATFLNNGGSDNLAAAANIYDFQLPMLSPMTANDARLR